MTLELQARAERSSVAQFVTYRGGDATPVQGNFTPLISTPGLSTMDNRDTAMASRRLRTIAPHSRALARIQKSMGISSVITLLQGGDLRLQESGPDREEPTVGSAATRFTSVLGDLSLNSTELSAYCRERACFDQVTCPSHARCQANRCDDGEQNELGKAPRPGPIERSKPQKGLQAQEKPSAEMLPFWLAKKVEPSARRRGS